MTKREMVQVGNHQLPKLPKRYQYAGTSSAENSIIQVRHVSSGHLTNMVAHGFINDYDKTVAVIDSIISCIAPEQLKAELAEDGLTIDTQGRVFPLPPEQRPLRADAEDANPENGGNDS